VKPFSQVTATSTHVVNVVDILDQCGSGRELDGRGHAKDKFIAGELDVSTCVAWFDGVAFVAG
jgi:hypothetical protein